MPDGGMRYAREERGFNENIIDSTECKETKTRCMNFTAMKRWTSHSRTNKTDDDMLAILKQKTLVN